MVFGRVFQASDGTQHEAAENPFPVPAKVGPRLNEKSGRSENPPGIDYSAGRCTAPMVRSRRIYCMAKANVISSAPIT
jgi:hypothetical protein